MRTATLEAFTGRPGQPGGPPGLYVQPRPPSGRQAEASSGGVPVFVGFARPRPDALERGSLPLVAVSHWHAGAFMSRVRPDQDSFLAAAVRGFFANGGRRCMVLAVEPPRDGTDSAAALVRALQPGGVLEERTDIDLVCVPDAVSPRVHVEGAWQGVQTAALAHCEAAGDRFALVDAPDPGGAAPDEAVVALLSLRPSLRSAYGALYVPWLAATPTRWDGAAADDDLALGWRCRPAAQPRGASAAGFVPPSGHVAGLYARTDAVAGPQRSPANDVLDDALDTSMPLDDVRHRRLNDGGVNVLRGVRGRGIVVGGARTLSGHARWAHVSTVRVVLGFRRWVATGLRDLVFEPHTPALWEQLSIRLLSRCHEMLDAGALAGADARQAFFVKCDGETNPPAGADVGRVIAHVGLAPSVPAEFIVVRVVHDANGSTVSGLP